MTTCRQIGAQTSIIMLAGYETTSVTLTYCIYLLSKHPQVQQKLLQEVDDFKGQPSYEQLDRFPYAAAVLNEAMRLFPPVPLFARAAVEAAQVKLKSDAAKSCFSYKKKSKEKTAPFVFNLMRSQVLYPAAQGVSPMHNKPLHNTYA